MSLREKVLTVVAVLIVITIAIVGGNVNLKVKELSLNFKNEGYFNVIQKN